MLDRTITITCTEVNPITGKINKIDWTITYESYDDLPKYAIGKDITQSIDRMRLRLKEYIQALQANHNPTPKKYLQ